MMKIYSKMFPVSVHSFDRMADAFCCESVRYTHMVDGATCGATCIFCEDECSECGAPLF